MACAPAPRVAANPPTVARIAGCYELRSGAWEQDAALDRFYPIAQIPRRIRLDTVRLRGADRLGHPQPLYTVEVIPPVPEWRSPFVSWGKLRLGSDSIHVSAPMAFGGATMRLLRVAQSLTGELKTFTDAIPEDGIAMATVPIVLDPIECPRRQVGVRNVAT
jgi:hypothetical protein